MKSSILLLLLTAINLINPRLALADEQAAKKSRPNVLFILTDDQRYDALSCMGHSHLQTPNIDRLAGEGLLFRNHFCTTSLCSPSRASSLSGLYAHTHGVSNNFTEYPQGAGSTIATRTAMARPTGIRRSYTI